MIDQWDLIYQQHVNDVYRFLLYFTGSREDAEDLTQDTFIRVLQKLDQFHHRSELRTWIISIAKNLAIDQIKKQKRRKLIRLALQENIQTQNDLLEELVSINESKRMLYNAIQSLNFNYRAVTILRGIQGLTAAETAIVLGWNQNKVNLVYHRAVKALRKRMTGRGDEVEWIGQLTN